MSNNRLVLPLAIIGAGMILALSLYVYLRSSEPELITTTDLTGEMRPVDDTDHILGNPAAPIMIIEYSDIDSPFAKPFETTLRTVIAKYGDSGSVAWVYRHLPLVDQHPFAVSHAEAAECMNAQGGANAFFRFIEEIQAAPNGAGTVDPTGYIPIVQRLGGDTGAFTACMADETYQDRIMDDASNALEAGAVGTPYTIFLVKGQEPVPIEGVITEAKLSQMIDLARQTLPK